MLRFSEATIVKPCSGSPNLLGLAQAYLARLVHPTAYSKPGILLDVFFSGPRSLSSPRHGNARDHRFSIIEYRTLFPLARSLNLSSKRGESGSTLFCVVILLLCLRCLTDLIWTHILLQSAIPIRRIAANSLVPPSHYVWKTYKVPQDVYLYITSPAFKSRLFSLLV